MPDSRAGFGLDLVLIILAGAYQIWVLYHT